MQRDNPSIDVPLYSCPPRRHQDPDFVRDSISAVLMRQGYQQEEAYNAAHRIEVKCRQTVRSIDD